MADATVAAIIFLSPIQDGFRQGHGGGGETNHSSRWPCDDMSKVKVGDVQEGFDDVEQSFWLFRMGRE